MATNDTRIIIRGAVAADEAELMQLAALDGVDHAPDGAVLVAEAGGHVRAAYGVEDGRHVADPFWPSAELVELLRLHAAATMRPVKRSRFSRLGVRHAAPVLAGGR